MKKFPIALIAATILTGCSGDVIETSAGLDSLLENPLYAERYYDDLVDTMVDLVIQNDPMLEQEGKADLVEKTRKEALEKAQEATRMQRDGYQGAFVSDYEYTYGELLILNGTLYTGPDFETAAGPALHAYLTTLVDPRIDNQFPDAEALDLGLIHNAFGAQTIPLPTMPEDGTGSMKMYPTVVLYDQDLERIYGFAQLRRSR